MKYVAGLFLFAALSLVFALGQEPEDPYEKGLRIIREQGSGAGIDYFKTLAVENRRPSSVFFVGWSLYVEGRHTEAQELVEYLIPRVKEGGYTFVNCHYLLGLIASAVGEFESAEGCLRLSLKYAKNHERGLTHQLSFNALCALGNLSLKQDDFHSAQNYLKRAQDLLEMNPKLRESAFLSALQSRIAFKLGDYANALKLAEKSWAGYEAEGDTNQALKALCGVTFFRFLNGDIDCGNSGMSDIAQAIETNPSGLVAVSYYNAVNWIIAKRCSDHSFSELENQVRQRILTEGDTDLKEHLEFALNWDCGR